MRPSIKDHPRSRGVYPRAPTTMLMTPGSSPLARGLRRHLDELVAQRGIIPARAGFTAWQRAGGRGDRDHPRSRGVYRIWRRYGWMIRGSSPLARGLLDRRSLPAVQRGDHPRSRGVYLIPTPHMSNPNGSSPLARGLRYLQAAPARPGRIIPARAGFTVTSEFELADWLDHPRSRGVYGRRSHSAYLADGSSPLARGLRP